MNANATFTETKTSLLQKERRQLGSEIRSKNLIKINTYKHSFRICHSYK